MKKIMTITVEVDTEHPEKERWQKEKDFIEAEFDDALYLLTAFNIQYRNCSGETPSGAAKYKIHIKNIQG